MDDEARALELARQTVLMLAQFGYEVALLGAKGDTVLLIPSNERAIVPLCNRILAAYAVPGGRTLQ